MAQKRIKLPIDEVLPELLSALEDSPNVVLQAPTGAGKTTRVPPALMKLASGRILVLEPRRLAARATARRMAAEAGQRVGETFGYQVRFERCFGAKSKVITMTPGVLVGKLQQDAFLEGVAAIIFDEFHERSLDSDLSFGMARLLQQTVRPELKMVVMSATLDVMKIAKHLDHCPVVQSKGRLYPVAIDFQQRKPNSRLELAVANAVDTLLAKTRGDLLVFLPGKRDIQKCAEILHSLTDVKVLPLHGELSSDKQDQALKRLPQRKVVLATNVAESSVTVEGITGVVDSGLAKVLTFDNGLGLNRLKLTAISRASAEQRSGRAGRVEAGHCIRLWGQDEERSRPDRQAPELLRVELSRVVLTLLALGERRLDDFPWLDKPREASLDAALTLLQKLEAIDQDRQMTALGAAMVKLPVTPRLGRLLIAGHQYGQSERIALTAALLSGRDPFKNSGELGQGSSSPSDILDKVEALEAFQQSGQRHSDCGTLYPAAVRFLFKAQKQLVRALSSLPKSLLVKEELAADEVLLRSLLKAFPDRLARRRDKKSLKGVMIGGRGVKLARSSRVLESDLFLCVDIDAGRSEAFVRQASGVQREWLDEDKIKAQVELDFDDEDEKLLARRRLYFDDLLLEESPANLPAGEALTEALAKIAGERFDMVRPKADSRAGQLIIRARCLSQWMPEFEWPDLTEAGLKDLLPWLCPGCRSFDALRKAPWYGMIRGLFVPKSWLILERQAPGSLKVPSGRALALSYEQGQLPVLAVRIQELFGLHETPTVAAGRVRIQLILLAPNNRPQQITDDLVSFWNNTYPQVRKDLRGRYPKHSWPEDPWAAKAEIRPRRRKR
jgi:ATP-dependent helicase HrpB